MMMVPSIDIRGGGNGNEAVSSAFVARHNMPSLLFLQRQRTSISTTAASSTTSLLEDDDSFFRGGDQQQYQQRKNQIMIARQDEMTKFIQLSFISKIDVSTHVNVTSNMHCNCICNHRWTG